MSDIPPSNPTGYRPPAKGGSGMATAALVLGIVSLILFCVPYVSIPAAILAIVLGAMARNRVAAGVGEGRGMATAGMICGIIALVLVAIAFAGCLAALNLLKSPEVQKQIEQMQKEIERQQTQPATGPSAMLNLFSHYSSAWRA